MICTNQIVLALLTLFWTRLPLAPCSLCFINRDARLASLIVTPRPQSVTRCVARSLVSPSCFLAFFARSRYGVHGDISSPMVGATAAASSTRTLALLACWCGDDREVVDEKERCQDRALEHIGKVESRNHASGKITNGKNRSAQLHSAMHMQNHASGRQKLGQTGLEPCYSSLRPQCTNQSICQRLLYWKYP